MSCARMVQSTTLAAFKFDEGRADDIGGSTRNMDLYHRNRSRGTQGPSPNVHGEKSSHGTLAHLDENLCHH